MSAVAKLIERHRERAPEVPLVALSASGQLGYGILEPALNEDRVGRVALILLGHERPLGWNDSLYVPRRPERGVKSLL